MDSFGVFACDFNPIHLGHTNFLKEVKKKFNLNKILIVNSNIWQQNSNQISLNEKNHLIKLAIKNLNFLTFLKKEFSFELLKNLAEKNKDKQMFLIIWPHYLSLLKNLNLKKILKYARIVSLAPTKKINFLKDRFKNIEIEKTNLQIIKSFKIRIMLALKKDCSILLNPLVLQHIQKNNLFCEKESLFLECYDICKKNTSTKRFNHCNFVSKAAVKLAKIYKENEEDAKIAGLLHDILKEKTKEYMLNLFKSFNFKLNETQKTNPKVWHGLAGAIYIEKILGIDLKNIVNAVKYHTVPRKNMTKFEKIVFMADRISLDRKYKDVEFLRNLAEKNLNEAILYSLKNTITVILKKENTISIPTVECYNNLIFKKKMENLKYGGN